MEQKRFYWSDEEFILDEGIGGEISNLEDIMKNEKIATESLRNAAEKAKG